MANQGGARHGTFSGALVGSIAGKSVGAIQAALPLDPLENRILLCHATGLTRIQLITQSERILQADEAARLAALVQRRLDGEPIAYIVGRREFFGLDFQVNDAVLIPRPDTELIVELALERLPPRARVLDMGTGSGAIAVALAHSRPDAQVCALDVSPAALDVARANAAANGAAVRFLRSDWFAALQGAPQSGPSSAPLSGLSSDAGAPEIFDLIVSNPPYIAAGDAHLSQGDLRFEPAGALTDHADGLSALRIIIDGAPGHLVDGAWLLLEHGYDQAAAVRALLAQRGFTDVRSWRDLGDNERVSGGRFMG